MKRLLRHGLRLVPALLSLALLAWTLRTADLGGFHRLAIDAERARGGLASRSHARLFA